MWVRGKQPELLDVFWTQKPMWMMRSEVDFSEWLKLLWPHDQILKLIINKPAWSLWRVAVLQTARERNAKFNTVHSWKHGDAKARSSIVYLDLVAPTARQTEKAGCSGSLSQWHRECDEGDWCRPDQRRKIRLEHWARCSFIEMWRLACHRDPAIVLARSMAD